jgi:putative ABC transport system permease protein
MLGKILQDLRFTVRGLARTPIFTAAVITTLALGIGANTAIFTIVDRLLLRPLPYPHAEQVVMMHEISTKSPRMDVSPGNWLDWQRESKSFESIAAWNDRFNLTLTGEGEPERLKTQAVSHEFFGVLGVHPIMGRDFVTDDDKPGVPRRVILGYSLWQRRFGGSSGIVGKTIQLNATAIEVIGIMPAGFRFMSNDTDLWLAYALDRNRAWRDQGGRSIPYVVGRLKPSVTPAAAQAEMRAIMSRFAQLYPFNKDTSAIVIPLRDVITGEVRTSLLVLLAAVGVLLMIACFNVANLLVSRSAYRRREIAIRSSLGAGRAAIVRQIVLESLTLALAAGVAAVLVARGGIAVLLAVTPPALLQMADVSIDGWILLYTFGITVIIGVALGLVPAVPLVRGHLTDHLQDGGRSVTSSARVRRMLIVAQVAMTVVLLCGAGLLVRTFLALTHDPVGVNAANVLTLRVDLPGARYNNAKQVAFFRQALEKLQALPGVESTGAARDLPVSRLRISGTSFRIQGEAELPPDQQPSTWVRVAAPGYFKTLGISVLKGREFINLDQVEGAEPVFIVNAAFAKKFFPTRDPLSSAISVFMDDKNPFGRIVGVVDDVKEGSLRNNAEPAVYYTNGQLASNGMTLFIRSSRGTGLAREAIQVIRELDPLLPVTEVRMLEEAFGDTVARERLNAVVSGAFAASALLLASLGLYGLLAFTVAERTREIGVRMALGAGPGAVLQLVLANGLRLVTLGAVIGSITAFGLARFLQGLLFGVTAYDPLTFAAVISLLMFVSVLAVWVPAYRATTVNPVVALRKD